MNKDTIQNIKLITTLLIALTVTSAPICYLLIKHGNMIYTQAIPHSILLSSVILICLALAYIIIKLEK